MSELCIDEFKPKLQAVELSKLTITFTIKLDSYDDNRIDTGNFSVGLSFLFFI